MLFATKTLVEYVCKCNENKLFLFTSKGTHSPPHTWTEQWRSVQLGAGLVRRGRLGHVGVGARGGGAGAGGGADRGTALDARVVSVPHVYSFIVVAARVAPS